MLCIWMLAAIAVASDDGVFDSFSIPTPEEIDEAWQTGVIEYDDYLRLLEISRSDALTVSDSDLVRQFPDLVAGVESNLTMGITGDEKIAESASQEIEPDRWRSSALVRQYVSLTEDECPERLMRIQGANAIFGLYGEMKECQAESHRWYRRSVEYRSRGKDRDGISVVIGNYKTDIGMGLVYGYHGQKLTKASVRSGYENFLFPRFGGGNGVSISGRKKVWMATALFDMERNESTSSRIMVMSARRQLASAAMNVSVGFGEVRNRLTGAAKPYALFSIAGGSERKKTGGVFEIAAADYDDHVPAAAAFATYWKRSGMNVRMEGWVYNRRYPAYFAGGPSSRRTSTRVLDDIDLSYRDTYAGEKGGTIKTSFSCVNRSTIRAAMGYTVRGYGDYRMEETVGVQLPIASGTNLALSYFHRQNGADDEYRRNEKIRMEVCSRGKTMRTRMIVGYSLNDYQHWKGYMAMFVWQILNSPGRLDFTLKFDNLNLSRLENRYTYCTLGYRGDIGSGLESCLRYSYRYRRGGDGRDDGTIRVDMLWNIE